MNTEEMNILIIDDEEILCKTLSAFLEDEGYGVIVAATGTEALAKIDGINVNLSIVDVNLPDIDGATLIQLLNKKVPDMKFIIHTGDLNYTIPVNLNKIGITSANILFKPVIDLNSMADVIASICSK